MFKTPSAQWEKILTKPLEKQIKFLNKVCSVSRNDSLMIRGAFFNNLSFDLVKKVFKLVRNVVKNDGIDSSFEDLILDRLLWVSEIAHLYPEDRSVAENIIFGEGYHVYSAAYDDLDLINKFLNSRDDIESLCDLGSGTGRALLYIALEADRKIDYLGLELVSNRVEFTNSIASHFQLGHLNFKTSNFLETPQDFQGYDAYYLYDPVGTDDVSLLISYFAKMIQDGAKFYIIFISGWDDLMHNALNDLTGLKMISTHKSLKQKDRVVNFYKVI